MHFIFNWILVLVGMTAIVVSLGFVVKLSENLLGEGPTMAWMIFVILGISAIMARVLTR